jgi:O-antigen/teichoic acid export membrane protein
VQALGVASGIFLVRTLDQTQYAYYTIALTMQTTMGLLADMGISVGLSAIGGKVWKDKYRFGQLINTAMQLRYYLAYISIAVVTPILLWMLIKNGASIIEAILITIVVLVGLNFQLTNTVLSVVLRLHSQIDRVQHLELTSTISRLVLLGVAYLTFLNATAVMIAYSMVLGLQRLLLERWVTNSIDRKAPINVDDRKFILAKIRVLAPNGIFFCIQTQITVWLISLFGSTENIAEIGALGRLAVIFTLITSIMNTIVLPSFARCQSKAILRRRYFQILGCIFVFEAAMLGIATLWTYQLVWILGSQYYHLENEVSLMVLSATISSITQVMASLNSTKAWVQYSWIEIPLRISLQVILLLILDISTIRGILLFSIFSQISPLTVSILRTYLGFKDYEKTYV